MANYYKASGPRSGARKTVKVKVKPHYEEVSSDVADVAAETEAEVKPAGEKLQKVIARSGHASRRESERLIAQNRVKIGKRIAQLGDRVDGSESIFMDDK